MQLLRPLRLLEDAHGLPSEDRVKKMRIRSLPELLAVDAARQSLKRPVKTIRSLPNPPLSLPLFQVLPEQPVSLSTKMRS